MTEEPKLLLEEEKEFKRFYRVSLWWVEHRVFLRKFGYGVFMSGDILLFAFVSWLLFDAFVLSFEADQQEVVKLAVLGQNDLHAYTLATQATDLLEETVRVFPLGAGRSDFYTQLTNPNMDWWVEFEYQFLFDSGSTPLQRGFLLPGQSKPFLILAVPETAGVTAAQIEFKNISWHRIDNTVIQDIETWLFDRTNIAILDPEFTLESGFEQEIFGRSTFMVHNRTAFGYYDLPFYVLLKRGAAVVGVNQATVANLGAGETVDVSLQWFGTLPSLTSIEVISDVAVFDPEVYQSPPGAAGLDTRYDSSTNF